MIRIMKRNFLPPSTLIAEGYLSEEERFKLHATIENIDMGVVFEIDKGLYYVSLVEIAEQIKELALTSNWDCVTLEPIKKEALRYG